MFLNATLIASNRGEYDAQRESTPHPPQYVLDKIADEKFSARFNIRRSNQCSNCFEVKTVTGSCSCL
jgi:hypothetical protein